MQLVAAPFIKELFTEALFYFFDCKPLPLAKVYLFQKIQPFHFNAHVVSSDILRRLIGAGKRAADHSIYLRTGEAQPGLAGLLASLLT